MNEVKISILVPIYKVEKYLRRCVDSVLSQDFKEYELILVDDGSPDSCPRICDEYAKADGRIHVIHKQNGGLVSARLAGFQVAQGDYIMFLDSDDYLMPGALKVLYDKIIEGYDIVKGNDLRFCDDGELGIEKPKWVNRDIVGSENYLEFYMSGCLLPYLWGGLYRKSLFDESIFKNILDISVYEDGLTNIAIWRGVERYIAIDHVVCAYYINQRSMMQGSVLSHAYHNRITELMLQYVNGLQNDKIKRMIYADRMAGHLRCFFMPEIGWDESFYRCIKVFVRDSCNFMELQKKVEAKFLRFLPNSLMFRAYTWIYRIFYKKVKLKNKKRKVL